MSKKVPRKKKAETKNNVDKQVMFLETLSYVLPLLSKYSSSEREGLYEALEIILGEGKKFYGVVVKDEQKK